MNRYWIVILGLLLTSLLFWQCREGETAQRTEAAPDSGNTSRPSTSDQLLLPFPPNWSSTNPPLLYYGRDARFLDPRHRSDATNTAPASRSGGVRPETLSE